jgi:5-hydroxyisourate hydrolase
MSAITTHVLDTSRGRPAGGVTVTLEFLSEEGWKWLGGDRTDDDGRAQDLFGGEVVEGTYRLTFDTASYFSASRTEGFFPLVQLVFKVRDPSRDHHVPLLLSPYGYSTYRGS